jgi:omega-amidase
MLSNKVPVLKSFRLALIQLGSIGSNKSENLRHAREMILKAAGHQPKPNLIVLPVLSLSACAFSAEPNIS